MELTGHESGIIVYVNDDVAVVNWSGYGDNELPRALVGYMGGFPQEDIFEGVTGVQVDDLRTELPAEMCVIYDENNDIAELMNDSEPTAAGIFSLNDGTKIISPYDWN